MIRKLALALATATLAGCTAGVTTDVHTSTQTAYSKDYPAKVGLIQSLNAQAIHSNKAGYAVKTRYTGFGWMFIEEAWSFGSRFPFESTGRGTLTCSQIGCSNFENGVFLLTEDQFQIAAEKGLEFKLVGRNGSIVGKLPAEAFAEVMKLRYKTG